MFSYFLRALILGRPFHRVDKYYFDGLLIGLEPQPELLLKRSENGWTVGEPGSERQSEIVGPFNTGLVDNGSVDNVS